MAASSYEGSGVVAHFFTFVREDGDRKTVVRRCKLCHKEYKGQRNITSNFFTHLKHAHRVEFESYFCTQQRPQPKMLAYQPHSMSTVNYPDTTNSASPVSSIPSPQDARLYQRKFDSLERLFVTCQLPFDLLDNNEFKCFVQELDPCFQMPSQNTFCNYIIQRCEFVEQTLRGKLQSVESIVASLDVWFSKKGFSYIAVGAHFISADWVPEHRVVAFEKIAPGEGIAAIQSEYEAIIEKKFDLSSRVMLCVRNDAVTLLNGLNHTIPGVSYGCEVLNGESFSAVELDNFNDFVPESVRDSETLNSFAYSLQLVIKDGLVSARGVHKPFQQLQKIIEYLKDYARIAEPFFDSTLKMVLQKNPLRWNESLKVTHTLLEMWETVVSILNDNGRSDIIITEQGRLVLQEFLDIMMPFEEATSFIQSENGSYASCCIPTYIALRKHLQLFSAEYLSDVVTTLTESLDAKLAYVCDNPTYVLTTILHPKWKTAPFQVTEKEDFAIGILRDAVDKIRTTAGISVPVEVSFKCDDSDGPPPTKQSRFHQMVEFLQMSQNKPKPKDEVQKYLEEDCEVSDVLFYWWRKEQDYPCLALLAKKYLAIPASSIPIERLSGLTETIRINSSTSPSRTLSSLNVYKCNLDLLYS